MAEFLIVEDDYLMGECIARALAPLGKSTIVADAVAAMNAISDAAELPKVIFLDVLLNGPSGFTLLNELASYTDTAAIPVILVTSLNLAQHDLTHYGVRAVLDKATMAPRDIYQTAAKILATPAEASDV